MKDLSYYPQFGQILIDGKLRIPFSDRSDDGEILDGHVDINSDDPRYAQWILAIQSKEQFQTKMKDQAAAARHIRRNTKKN